MTTTTFKQRALFLLFWVLASTAGLVVGLVGGSIVGMPASLLLDMLGLSILGMAVIGAVYGAATGLAQWLTLRYFVSWAGRWALYSAAGGSVGFLVGYVAGLAVEERMGDSIHGLVLGASLGAAQWFILRHAVPWAWLWIAVSTVGMGIVWSFPIAIMAEGGILRLAVQTTVYGVITGGCLLWLMRQGEPDTPGG
jgi:hypothetical protein